MEWTSISFDWNQVRAFLIAAEEGSFSAAARAAGISQPTLGRQVAALEDKLGVTLFERLGRSLELTEAGMELLDHVRAMGDAANRLSLAASGHSQKIEGRVCISATDLVTQTLLPPALHQIRKDYPGIDIDLAASDSLSDLQRREADIAIRHTRPEQPDLIARLTFETPVRYCASQGYLNKHGCPQTLEELANHDFVGFDQSGRMRDYLVAAGLALGDGNIHIRSDNGVVSWEMVKQGFGVGIMAPEIIERTEAIEILLPEQSPATLPFWLVAHRELHTSRRIRLVYDLLAAHLVNIHKKGGA